MCQPHPADQTLIVVTCGPCGETTIGVDVLSSPAARPIGLTITIIGSAVLGRDNPSGRRCRPSTPKRGS